MSAEVFRSERDGDLCRFWRGPVAGTFSASDDEVRVATCTTMLDVFTAITEREDSEMTTYMLCKDGVEIATYGYMPRAASAAEALLAEEPEALITVVLVADDPVVADALADPDAPKDGQRVRFSMPFDYVCDNDEFTVPEGETGIVRVVESDGLAYVKMDDEMPISDIWENEIAVDLVEFPGVLEVIASDTVEAIDPTILADSFGAEFPAQFAAADPDVRRGLVGYLNTYAGPWGLKASEEDAVLGIIRAVWPEWAEGEKSGGIYKFREDARLDAVADHLAEDMGETDPLPLVARLVERLRPIVAPEA